VLDLMNMELEQRIKNLWLDWDAARAEGNVELAKSYLDMLVSLEYCLKIRQTSLTPIIPYNPCPPPPPCPNPVPCPPWRPQVPYVGDPPYTGSPSIVMGDTAGWNIFSDVPYEGETQ
jgi:hypothetical protein